MPPLQSTTKLPLGSPAPEFELLEPLSGKIWRLSDFEGSNALLVMFICNHCPFVIHLKSAIVDLTKEYVKKGVAAVAISSNSVKSHPEDGPDFMVADVRNHAYEFPYLYDETQEVAKAYGAVCTPEFFLFKKGNENPFELVYHGRFDDSRPNSKTPITGRDLRQALNSVVSGSPLTGPQLPSIGCSIKWHPEND